MENFHKNKVFKEIKNLFQFKKLFKYKKKKYNPNIDDEYFYEKNKINKINHKISFNPTESIINDEIKNIKKENNYTNNNLNGKNDFFKNDIKKVQIIPDFNKKFLPNFSLYDNSKNRKMNYSKICVKSNENNEFSHIINKNSNIKLYQNSKFNPNFNYNNNFYRNSIPQKLINSKNNYYFNNNIIIYNAILRNNFYLNSNLDNNDSFNYNNIVNPYFSEYFSSLLFSKNDEDSKSEKNKLVVPKKENTCILEINIKLDNNKKYNFKLNKFDDLFETVQIFCQINKLNSNLYIPIIINIMKALNSIYGIYNMKLNEKEINELQFLKCFFFNSDNNSI